MNEIEKKEELERLLKKAKDFWATPYEELIEQGYGVIEDPVSALKAELKEIKSKPWYPGQGSRIKELKELIK